MNIFGRRKELEESCSLLYSKVEQTKYLLEGLEEVYKCEEIKVISKERHPIVWSFLQHKEESMHKAM